MARVMRARPSVVTSDVLHGDADARRVNGNRAEIAAHDFAAVPARLAHRAVTVVATGNLRARLLGFRPRLELGVASFAHVHGRFPIFHVVIVRLQDGVTVYLNRRLRSGTLTVQDVGVVFRGDVLDGFVLVSLGLAHRVLIDAHFARNLRRQQKGGDWRGFGFAFDVILRGHDVGLEIGHLLATFVTFRRAIHENV